MVTLNKKSSIPNEFEGIAKKEDLTLIHDKLGRCYTEDRFEHFQEAVEKIVLKTLGQDEGRKKIKSYAREEAKEYSNEDWWKKINFWLPIILSIVSLILAYYSYKK
jgi:hypothetical protein